MDLRASGLLGETHICGGNKTCYPQISLWHMDHFELKTIKAQKTQEELLTFPLAA